MEDKEAQEDEMTALKSIMDDCFSTFQCTENSLISGQINIEIHLPNSFYLYMKNESSSTATNSPSLNSSNEDGPSNSSKMFKNIEDDKIIIKHLPCLTLHFTLPINYPSVSSPIFTLTSSWLDRQSLSFLCNKLDLIWEENSGMAILYLWTSVLKDETLSILNFKNSYNIYRVIEDIKLQCKKTHNNNKNSNKNQKEIKDLDNRAVVIPVRSENNDKTLLEYLRLFNEEKIRENFLNSSQACEICFTEKLGRDSIQFHACDHVFCLNCVGGYFSTHILDGNLDAIRCPSFKCDTVPNPNQVEKAVGKALFERYDRILLSRTLESMSDIQYCPRVKCHYPVICDPNDNMASCSSCRYVFCRTCKMVYHGVEPCRFKEDERRHLYSKYIDGTSEEKMLLEKTYGKKQLVSLVQTIMSQKWIDKQTKPCPHCKASIDKYAGCNKVTCFKCSTYFCWICLKQLDQSNPYFHFNNPLSPCFNNLFQNDNEDEEEEEEFEDLENIEEESSDDEDDFVVFFRK